LARDDFFAAVSKRICELPSVSKARQPKPAPPKKSPRNARPWQTAEEPKQLLAERAGVPPVQVSVFGDPDNWDAALMVNQIGNAECKAKFRTLVCDLRTEFDLKSAA
jgi:hypothetical protein